MKDIETIYATLLDRYPCVFIPNGVDDNRLNFQLSNAIKAYFVYVYGIEKKENSFKYYPVTIADEEVQRLYEIEFKKLVEESIQSNTPIEILMSNKIKEYQSKFEENKKYALSTPMEPYYGNPHFMFERANYILECIEKLPIEHPNLNSIFMTMKSFMEKYGNEKNDWGHTIYPFYDEEYKKAYREFEKSYYGILEIEKALSKEVEKIWKSTLTDTNNHQDTSFHYLIHVFSSGMIPLESMGKVCCSLASSQLLTTPYGDSGIICDFDSEAVEVMCSEDAGSWRVDKNEFVERLFPDRWQVTDPSGIGVWFEEPRVSKLLLPTDLERETIAHNVRINGEALNYSKYTGYSEIYLNSKAKAIGVFYTDECKNVDEITAYAQKYNLPLIHLSLEKLRENAGLPPKAEKKEENSSFHY